MNTEQELKALLGKNVKIRRTDRNWSQEFLAEKVGVQRNEICNIEKGDNFVTAQTLINLARAFETEVYELFKPDNVQPDNANDMLAKYSFEVKEAVDRIHNKYFK